MTTALTLLCLALAALFGLYVLRKPSAFAPPPDETEGTELARTIITSTHVRTGDWE